VGASHPYRGKEGKGKKPNLIHKEGVLPFFKWEKKEDQKKG